MKIIKKITNFSQLIMLDLILMSSVQAQSNNALQQATGSSQNFTTVATKANDTMNNAVGLITLFFGLVGLIMVANSLINLYKSSKDPSHQVKPLSGAIGLIIGGLLLAVGTVAGLSKNTLIGN